MSDRIIIPTFTARARGAIEQTFKGDRVETQDGRALWTVVVMFEVPSRWRPGIPELVEAEVSVPGPIPKIETDDEVEFIGVTLRAGVRKSGAAYLGISADEVRL